MTVVVGDGVVAADDDETVEFGETGEGVGVGLCVDSIVDEDVVVDDDDVTDEDEEIFTPAKESNSKHLKINSLN